MGSERLNRTKLNYVIDLILTILFLVVASIGLLLYFFIPSGIRRGGYIVYMGLTKTTWIWIHSRAGLLMIIVVLIHLILHRHWIICTTRNFFRKEKEKTDVCES
jgi:hypothetical protein